MSKYLKRVGTKKDEFLIQMKILSVTIPVKEPVERLVIEWRRGNKRNETL
jgi:hypothetical protein